MGLAHISLTDLIILSALRGAGTSMMTRCGSRPSPTAWGRLCEVSTTTVYPASPSQRSSKPRIRSFGSTTSMRPFCCTIPLLGALVAGEARAHAYVYPPFLTLNKSGLCIYRPDFCHASQLRLPKKTRGCRCRCIPTLTRREFGQIRARVRARLLFFRLPPFLLGEFHVTDPDGGHRHVNRVQRTVSATSSEKITPALTHVLVVDDDPSIRQMVVDYLSDNEIQVTALSSGREIADVTAHRMIDLLILDLKLPGENGMDIARRIRADSNMPIIMLTARKEEADRVMALELGADDYLTKPFSPRELLARIRSLLRRSRAHETVADGLARIRAYRFAGWELNVRVRRLKSPQGELMTLRNAEFNLLAAFLASPQRVLTREQLLSMSHLHDDEVYDRAIDTQVGRLRRKLEEHGASQELIHTERGAGYVLNVPVEVVR